MFSSLLNFVFKISIHTPTKGATNAEYISLSCYAYFNPHSHEGSDCFFLYHHLPYCNNFNPHSHEGSDSFSRILSWHPRRFQSTLPRRERHIFITFQILFRNFNPHSHEGSDCSYKIADLYSSLFQSTLPRRERRRIILYIQYVY